jgi:hypothetical protein
MKPTAVRVFLLIVLSFALSTARSSETAAAPAIDNGEPLLLLFGHCALNPEKPELTGYCVASKISCPSGNCRFAMDSGKCPVGVRPIKIGSKGCGRSCNLVPVDLGRLCTFHANLADPAPLFPQ